MPYVPDQSVIRSIEHVVQGDGELYDPQPRTQMAPGGGDRVDGLGAQLVGKLPQVALVKPPEIRRIDDCIQKRLVVAKVRHLDSLSKFEASRDLPTPSLRGKS